MNWVFQKHLGLLTLQLEKKEFQSLKLFAKAVIRQLIFHFSCVLILYELILLHLLY